MEIINTLQPAVSTVWLWVSDNAAGIVALLAMFATAYQAYVARVHNRISVRPQLATTSGTYTVPEGVRVTALLHNAGLGPAFIESFEILVGDKAHPVVNPDDVIALVSKSIGTRVIHWTCHVLRKGTLLRAGEDITVADILFSAPKTLEAAEQFQTQVENLQLLVRYRSLYGERAEYDSRVHKGEASPSLATTTN
ncbi:MAG: hypothetical protein H6943_03635 [Zoogloeaceae bacterium]|nr:hypothetical protein [Zoogloeaceae bacterium]